MDAGTLRLGLIDCQNEMFEVICSETSAAMVELRVRLLAEWGSSMTFAARAEGQIGGGSSIRGEQSSS